MNIPGRRDSLLLVLVLGLALAGCATIDPAPAREPSFALPPDPSVQLSATGAAIRAEHGEDRSGFLMVADATEALRWRLRLIEHAERSVDLQYYIWSEGPASTAVLDALDRAVDRGVRVRVLLDDMALGEHDELVGLLSSNPLFEIRLFNPQPVRGFRPVAKTLDALFSIHRMNQRMHNKLFIVDNHVAMLGGRNLADEYYGLHERFNFLDLDVVVAGPAVEDLSEGFDSYWNSELAYPGTAFESRLDPEEVEREFRAEVTRQAAALGPVRADSVYWDAIVRDLPRAVRPGRARVVYDEAEGTPDTVAYSLAEFTDHAEREILIMVAYVIPTEELMERVRSWRARGLRVRILTNSLASLDSNISHSFYKKYRRDLLEAGVEIHEMRFDPRDRAFAEAVPGSGEVVGMHTKLVVMDRRYAYVGSFNFEPRAVFYNRENGILIDSLGLAGDLVQYAERFLDEANSWRVELDDEGDIRWRSGDEVLTDAPARGTWQRVSDGFLGILPIPSEFL